MAPKSPLSSFGELDKFVLRSLKRQALWIH